MQKLNIGESTYIRKFTGKQKEWIEKIAQERNIPYAPKVLLFALEQYFDNQRDIRTLTYNKDKREKKIEELESEIENLKKLFASILTEELKIKESKNNIEGLKNLFLSKFN